MHIKFQLSDDSGGFRSEKRLENIIAKIEVDRCLGQ